MTKLNIEQVRELDAKRTQGEWYRASGGQVESTELNHLDLPKHITTDYIRDYDAEFIALTPQMAKLIIALDDFKVTDEFIKAVLIRTKGYLNEEHPDLEWLIEQEKPFYTSVINQLKAELFKGE